MLGEKGKAFYSRTLSGRPTGPNVESRDQKIENNEICISKAGVLK